jgi:hypothetical protein
MHGAILQGWKAMPERLNGLTENVRIRIRASLRATPQVLQKISPAFCAVFFQFAIQANSA